MRTSAASSLGSLGTTLAGLGLGQEQVGLGQEGIGAGLEGQASNIALTKQGLDYGQPSTYSQFLQGVTALI